jgi:alanyl-tRNA synthetase
VTGQGALDFVAANERLLKNVAGLVRGGRDEVVDKVQQLVDRSRALEREVQQLKAKLASGGGSRDLLDETADVGGIKLLVARIDGVDGKALRDTVDRLKDRLGSGVVVLGSTEGDKVRLVAGVTKDLIGRVAAGDLIRVVAEQVGGKGGGRPDFAQAGGNRPERLDEALASVKSQIAGLSQ